MKKNVNKPYEPKIYPDSDEVWQNLENETSKPIITKKKKKYYTVWVGIMPGVYENWKDAESQVKGFQGSKYKSFVSKEDADKAFLEGFEKHIKY